MVRQPVPFRVEEEDGCVLLEEFELVEPTPETGAARRSLAAEKREKAAAGATPSLEAMAKLRAAENHTGFDAELAALLGETLTRFSIVRLQQAGRYAGVSVKWLPGHTLTLRPGEKPGWGPSHHRPVMVVTSRTLQLDIQAGRHLAGRAGEKLTDALTAFGVPLGDVYVTSAVKFPYPYPKMAAMPQAWVNEGLWHLRREIALVRPEYILCSGSVALKALLGRNAKMYTMQNSWAEYGGAKLTATLDIHGLLRNDEKEPGFLADLRFFGDAYNGRKTDTRPVHYEYVKDEGHLRDVLTRCAGADTVALDCEWAGDSPRRGGWLVAVQFSVRDHESFVVVLKSTPGGYSFRPNQEAAIRLLRDFLCRPGVRLIGQNLRSDMIWLHQAGIDLADNYAENGFDCMLAAHKLAENDEHNLTALILRYTDMAKYDYEAQRMLDAGYVHHTLPDEVLHPYAAADTDALMRLYPVLRDLLWRDHTAKCADLNVDPVASIGGPAEAELGGRAYVPSLWNLFFFVDMRSSSWLHEVEREGLPVDRERLAAMAELFRAKYDDLAAKLTGMSGNPGFNPNSSKQVQRVMFGPETDDGELRLLLTPIKAAGKSGKLWDRAVLDGDVAWDEEKGWVSSYLQPSTDGESIELLAETVNHPFLRLMKQFRDVGTMVKNVLTPPRDAAEVVVADRRLSEKEKADKGIGGHIDDDGRVRTSLSQMGETGRLRSSSPNLLNLPKAKESAFHKLFDGENVEIHPVRSCMRPPPGGYYVEADYQSAELWTLAYIADDPVFKEALMRKDARGEPVSFHTTSMMMFFKIEERFGLGLDDVQRIMKEDTPQGRQFKSWRIGAKSVNFGIPYGRSAAAIAQAVKSEGVDVTPEEAQEWVDGYYESFRKAGDYLYFCRRSVHDPGWLETPYGRRRRFSRIDDRAIMSAQEREATNFPIQSIVADSLMLAIHRLYRRRNETGMRTRIVLPIHDAIMLWVPYNEVAAALKLLRWAMVEAPGAEVPGIGLRYGIDTEIYERWNEHADPWDLHRNTRGEVDERPKCGECGKRIENKAGLVTAGKAKLCAECADRKGDHGKI